MQKLCACAVLQLSSSRTLLRASFQGSGPKACAGTGKTLVARALAASASRAHGRPVAFFMRKGADVLSKWVGEAEQQLRLLFEARCRVQVSGPCV